MQVLINSEKHVNFFTHLTTSSFTWHKVVC